MKYILYHIMIDIICFFVLLIIILLFVLYPRKNTQKIIISIEGNIGAGKTTLLKLLETKYSHIAEFIYEPVSTWTEITDDAGNNIISLFYNDKTRWCYTFQNFAYITRMQLIVDMLITSNKKIIFIDRSLDADLHVFAKMLYNNKIMSNIEWGLYNKWNTFFNDYYGMRYSHKIVYLKCSLSTLCDRIKLRNRLAEQSISLDYIDDLNNYHNAWLTSVPNKVLTIDANKELNNQLCDSIFNFAITK